MKLYMKQKIFSWTDKFYINDEYGTDRYYVEGEFLSLGKKLHVYDMNHNEVAFIQQKLLTFLPRFYVFMGGKEVAEIVKEFTFFTPKYSINGPDWDVTGSFMAHDYSIHSGIERIARVHKVWMSWGDSYEIDLGDNDNIVMTGSEVMTLAVVLAIDAVLDAENASAAANSGG